MFVALPLKALQSTPAVARTVIGALLNAVFEREGAVESRVLFLLDEVSRLGRLSILETARDAGRKYGLDSAPDLSKRRAAGAAVGRGWPARLV